MHRCPGLRSLLDASGQRFQLLLPLHRIRLVDGGGIFTAKVTMLEMPNIMVVNSG